MRIVLIVHNIRSALNTGSLLRTADGMGVDEVYLTGYTPYPEVLSDTRLPHVRQKAGKMIKKTALGAEESVNWQHIEDVERVVDKLRGDGFAIAALEQTATSIKLPDYKDTKDIALILGSEVEGVDAEVLKLADFSLEIPMLGQKESFNVAVAGAIGLYQLRQLDKTLM